MRIHYFTLFYAVLQRLFTGPGGKILLSIFPAMRYYTKEYT